MGPSSKLTTHQARTAMDVRARGSSRSGCVQTSLSKVPAGTVPAGPRSRRPPILPQVCRGTPGSAWTQRQQEQPHPGAADRRGDSGARVDEAPEPGDTTTRIHSTASTRALDVPSLPAGRARSRPPWQPGLRAVHGGPESTGPAVEPPTRRTGSSASPRRIMATMRSSSSGEIGPCGGA